VKPRIPSLVIGGYLGAGKTTLVNHLLRHADGKRLAIMVNDFGEISIDADLIVSQDGNVLTLAGGCVCCSVGSDLMSALIELSERTPAPDMVLIETSGVALPAAVARSARLAPGIAIDAVVVLVDAETVRARAGDPYVGDTVCQQLQEADLLILNKLDLIDATALESLQDWLVEQAPQARILNARESQVPAELILGHTAQAQPNARQASNHSTVQSSLAQRPPFSEVARSGRIGPSPAADTRYETARFILPTPLDTAALGQALVAIRPGLLRFKGIMFDTQCGAVSMQGVGPRVRIEPAPGPAAQALHEGGQGQLVVIGRAGSLDHDAMASAIARALR
jgi:G3E family GTPase